MARTDIVGFLLQNGARANLFSMAVLGNIEAVTALIRAEPAFFNTRGPHFLTLLFHAALSGRVDLTEMVAAHLGDDRDQHFNQALRGAAQFGTVEMVEWLIENGVTNVNERNFWNETPLDVSLKRGDEAIAELLRKKGGVQSSP
jgi:ankyrin repeat protein